MSTGERGYLDLLAEILQNGARKTDRTGTGTLSVFGRQLRFALEPFPLLTTKMLHWKSFAYELLWGERVLRSVANLIHGHGLAMIRSSTGA